MTLAPACAGPEELVVRSPYSGETVGRVPLASRSAIREALDTCAASAPRLPRHERADVLQRVAAALAAEADELARLISRESGLALKDTRHELRRTQDVFRLAAAEALRDDGEAFAGDVSHHGAGRRSFTARVPVRLAVAITPFNHPLNQVAHKVAPAIAAGAPLVVKPSERTPLTALRLVEIIASCGWPAGALRVLCAEPAAFLDEALAHEAVEVISFTGSVKVGREIAGRLGYRRAILELGGNDALLVLADADLDEASDLAVRGAFANSGQRCTAVKRIIAVEPVADALVERIVARARRMRVGDPLDERTDVGTVISAEAAEEISGRIEEAVARGARLLCGGGRRGALLQPAVLDRVPGDAPLVAEETFGPVAPIMRVADLDEAIATANETRFGLSAGVVTNDWDAIARCLRELRVGSVNVREVPGWRTEVAPFGGVGDSGLGVKEGVRETMRGLTWVKLYSLPGL
jgi:putative phosphonoacetaldehyde dehydrogenase